MLIVLRLPRERPSRIGLADRFAVGESTALHPTTRFASSLRHLGMEKSFSRWRFETIHTRQAKVTTAICRQFATLGRVRKGSTVCAFRCRAKRPFRLLARKTGHRAVGAKVVFPCKSLAWKSTFPSQIER